MTNNLAWLLVLLLRSVLNKTVGQPPPPGFRYASYEVIIPRKQTPRSGHKEPHSVNYLLKLEGKNHLVYLRQKRAFVSKHFPVFTYSVEGDLQVDYPFIRDDCFYNGFVQGRAKSAATFSTCSGGLRGALQVENKSYEIEPVQASATFQHVVYRLEEEKGAIRMRCGLTQEEKLRQTAMIQNSGNVTTERSQKRPWWTHKTYAKIVIVVEHERYIQFGRNETVVALNVLNVIHLTNSWYDPLGIQVSLVGLEIWSERNLIDISNTMGVLLDRFNIWRRNILYSRLPHDAGHLFVYKHFFKGMLGLAFVGTVCGKHWSSGVESYVSPSLFFFTGIFAHEQGHILGMNHDVAFCRCEYQDCVMSAYHSTSDKFSNCSYKEYYNLMKSGSTRCLFSAGDPDKKYKLAYCGNRVVEHGEQCDCGSKQSCDLDPCCQSGCKLRSGVTCAFGECCSRCQYLPAGTVCRRSASTCDLPEYCNGTSAWCPEDVYVQDGTPCQDGAYCYHGNCSTHSQQCKMIFGSRATAASEVCFRKLNTQGDRFGNCGFYGSTYRKCNSKNILCGRVQCENVDKLPSLEGHRTIIQTRVHNTLCWGADHHHGSAIPDIGAVNDGTPCDKNMMCINMECTNISLLQYDCEKKKCQNLGICNSHKNCHCDYGWAPPYCLEEGYGGSIDSGPPPSQYLSTRRVLIRGLLIPFAVLVAIIVPALGVYYRANLMQRNRISCE
ncbi:disintegrin and metalloproteinase domain-containing protein 20-like [Sphaerodactylus townsendi]|uniref:disintegrin and metalloproteinase domain-containing protein 20-like n=1 Tax=Sphaerodactylus townsendi TaxID=933632 RepID=UPI002027252C|nr:disintegrin and metalloproteinase domain-containing protein 20-like [Sphaerodactylus townsendi]